MLDLTNKKNRGSAWEVMSYKLGGLFKNMETTREPFFILDPLLILDGVLTEERIREEWRGTLNEAAAMMSEAYQGEPLEAKHMAIYKKWYVETLTIRIGVKKIRSKKSGQWGWVIWFP